MRNHIFLSVSDRDRKVAEEICGLLEELGLDCWLATRDIQPGSDWGASIIEAIQESRLLLLILTRNANTSQHVKREVERAVNRDIPLLAFRVENIEPSPSLEYFLSTTQHFDAFELSLAASAKRLAAHLSGNHSKGSRAAESDEPHPAERSIGEIGYVKMLQDPSVLAGCQLDGYRLGRRIGRGGQGYVFEADDAVSRNPVCVKIMHLPQDALRPVHNTIFSCARSLAALNHPNIVPIVGFGAVRFVDAMTYYIAMQRIDGEHLDQWANSVDRDLHGFSSLMDVAESLAQALHAAHGTRFFDVSGKERMGVLHGDVTPNNILVVAARSYLSDFMMLNPIEVFDSEAMPDFGVLATGSGITSYNGTPGYMAPEQGQSGVLSVRADIHCFGVTLRNVFFGTELEFEGVAAEAIDSLRSLIDQMTANRAAERPQDIAEVIGRFSAVRSLVQEV